MVVKKDYYRKSGNQGSGVSKSKSTGNQKEYRPPKENSQSRSYNKEYGPPGENNQNKNYNKDSGGRQRYSKQSYRQRNDLRIRAEETLDDIRADITRIEKEIELEIREIRSLKL